MVFKVWALLRQLRHLLETCEKCIFSSQTPSGPTEAGTLAQQPSDLCFEEPPGSQWGTTALVSPTV